MGITEKSRFAQMRRNWNTRRRALLTDCKNVQVYGEDAPRFAECLWIDPAKINRAAKIASSKKSAEVISRWPEEKVSDLRASASIDACLRHWQEGQSWKETGIFDLMMESIRKKGKVDGLKNYQDVLTRYDELDKVFAQVRDDNRMRARRELVPGNFREEGGILVHIGPCGEPVFGIKGHHRLAMAIALELPRIPTQIGAVHRNGISSLPAYRKKI